MTTSIEQPVPAKPMQGSRQSVASFARHNGLQIGIIAVLLLMWGFLLFAAPLTFRSKEIYGALMSTVPLYGIMALPLTLLVVAQEVDLSFGSIMAISMVAFLAVFNATGSVILALFVLLLVGLLAGLLNGLIVVHLGIPSLIATIGTQFFWRGAANVITNARGGTLTAENNPLFNLFKGLMVGQVRDILPSDNLFGLIPAQMIWMIVVAIAMWILLNRHRFGAHIYLIGDNQNSARLMGVNVDRTRVLVFGLVGMLSAFAGLLASMEVSYFFPTLGDGYLLKTLAAVFLGGTPVIGGTGTILGTFVACFIIGTIEPGTVAIGLTGFWTNLIYGLIIVASVAMHTVLRRRMK
jgi:simple sugar transport system permease protein